MKEEGCKLPIREGHRPFLQKEETAVRPGDRKVAIVAAFLVLSAVTLMTVFTFLSVNSISELKQEIEYLKSSVSVLQKKLDNVSNNRNHPKNATSSAKSEKNDDIHYSDYNDSEIDYYEYYDSYDIYGDDDASRSSSGDNTLPLTGQRFTKDVKDMGHVNRFKRSIIRNTQGESSSELKRRNMTNKKHRYYSTQLPISSNPYPFYSEGESHEGLQQSTPTVKIQSRRIHVTGDDNSNSIRPEIKVSGDFNNDESPNAEFTAAPDYHFAHSKHRQRRLEMDDRHVRTGRMRPLPAAHFSGDTSKYVLGQHDNFNGNGHLRHPQRTFVDWTESNWFHVLGMDRHFSLTDGILTMKESGLYLIYAQVYYYDEHDINGFRVYRNENETLLQCTTMTHSAERVMKGNTCFTAGVAYFNENDRLSLGDLSESRYSLFEPGKSFFGAVKIGDVRIK